MLHIILCLRGNMIFLDNAGTTKMFEECVEVHKKFSDNHANYVNRLLELCENENNLVARDTLCGWTAFNCNGLVYFADKRRYAEIVARMKHFAYQNRHHLYKNHLAKFIYKTILWLGLKTWCRPKRCARTQAKQ